MTQHTPRAGFTLIELLVVMAIVSILLAITLPAVQRVREAVRRASCANNLRQIGIAIHSYQSSNGVYPILHSHYVAPNDPGLVIFMRLFSPHAMLLPYLEQQAAFNAINFELDAWDPASGGFLSQGGNPANSTAYGRRIEVFLCPSDSGSAWEGSVNNYRVNVGVGPALMVTAYDPDSGNGFLWLPAPNSSNAFPDGLSHTAAFCERLIGSGVEDLADPTRDFFLFNNPGTTVRTADQYVSACASVAQPGVPHFAHSGRYWYFSGYPYTWYTHALTPNARIPDCGDTTYGFPGVHSARSWHTGGVNTLMGDGVVRFSSEEISQDVWRAIGTRNGGEIVELF